MTSPTSVRAGSVREASVPAVSAAGVTAPPGTGGRNPSSCRWRPWWRRLWIPSLPRQSRDELRRASLEQLLALLEVARGELEAEWVQGGWWLVSGAGGQRRLLTGFAAGASTSEAVSAVCLVGTPVRA